MNRAHAKGLTMKMQVKAKYANGVLTPSLPLDIQEGAEVTLSLEVNPEPPTKDSVEATKKPLDQSPAEPYPFKDYSSDPRDFQDIILEIASKIPKEDLANIPSDFSENFDHYVYGVPKKSE